MNEIIENRKIVAMTSLEVVDLINNFREEEGNTAIKEHKTFMRDIRNEIEILKKLNIRVENNFVPYSYVAENGKTNPCYKMNKAGIMQMLNKESALVRYKTQQYIEVLENELKEPSKPLTSMELLKLQYNALEEQDQKIEEVKEDLKDFKEYIPLFTVECEEISKAVKRVGTKVLGGHGSKAYNNKSVRAKVYSDIHRQLKREFDVNSYKAIKRKYLSDALNIVDDYNLTIVLKEQINMLNEQVSFA
ncbi:ORF6C domain-containing protein [Paraclostridium bifermentans]|uniref:Phage regulatory protein n=1 Tax=Paraclostridium bifermentans TaxID=1490 RepID=A0AA44DJM3_PARBF|nr:ORF6C domain-containing protein [Paraclostridium bifermentans]MBN8046910.1 ORF6C domain-containing protein [Paraclostridium bifermentans]NME09018.1 phage regulatory protein [Paraclostridium bifermentans]